MFRIFEERAGVVGGRPQWVFRGVLWEGCDVGC